jgi:CRP-like cAMP-binding protein
MPGDVFGEMAIFDRQPRSATVRAKGNARVLTLDKRAFLKRVNEDPSFAFRILQIMSRHIRSLDEEFALLRSVATRVFLVRCLFIVSRDKTALYKKLLHDFSEDKEVEVVLDRRSAQRRQQVRVHKPERRRADVRSMDGESSCHRPTAMEDLAFVIPMGRGREREGNSYRTRSLQKGVE